jgi:hypothetical protein
MRPDPIDAAVVLRDVPYYSHILGSGIVGDDDLKRLHFLGP